jgi:cytoskeletal protein RodZ
MAKGLKEVRESSGLKIGDVSNATCICSRYLEAIEEGDFSKIPADVYVRGYIRVYANYLGVPFPEAFKEYEAYLENNRSGDKNGSIVRRKTLLQILSSMFLSS